MAQWVEISAVLAWYQSSIPGKLEGENQLQSCAPWQVHSSVCSPSHVLAGRSTTCRIGEPGLEDTGSQAGELARRCACRQWQNNHRVWKS